LDELASARLKRRVDPTGSFLDMTAPVANRQRKEAKGDVLRVYCSLLIPFHTTLRSATILLFQIRGFIGSHLAGWTSLSSKPILCPNFHRSSVETDMIPRHSH
jgi:hypothetical protein